MTEPYTRLLVERRGPVGWLVFNRPDAGNALDAVMFDELERAWRELDADPDVRVIVNTGAGSAFQTGVDLAQLANDPAGLRAHARRTRDAELAFTAWHLGVCKPVVAAVNGVATFSNLVIDASSDNYTLSATDGVLTGSGPSSSFAITAAAAARVAFGQQPTKNRRHAKHRARAMPLDDAQHRPGLRPVGAQDRGQAERERSEQRVLETVRKIELRSGKDAVAVADTECAKRLFRRSVSCHRAGK